MELFFAALILIAGISSCGKKDVSKNCSVVQEDTYSKIVCPDQSEVIVMNGEAGAIGQPGSDGKDGVDGTNGAVGSNGANGHSMVFNTIAATSLQCVAGGSVILLAQDSDDDGVLSSSDSNLQSAVICNGLQGSKGDPGPIGPSGSPGAVGPSGAPGQSAPPTPFTPVKLITPCTEASSPYKEQLLCLQGGFILASFSENANGKNTRFSLIPAGTYQNTDSSGCVFTVTNSSGLVVSWGAGSNQYATWSAHSEVCQ